MMYFSDERSNTNIDQDFSDKPKRFNDKYKRILIIILIILLLGIGILLIFNGSKKEVYLVLEGANDIIIYQDSNYIEYGYQAYDSKGNDLTSQVKIDNQVNVNVIGEYTVKYYLENITKTRTVTIIPKSNQMTYLILKGSQTIYLKVGEKYQEAGYEVLDTQNNISKDQVIVTGNVDTSKVGTYKLVYSLKRQDGVTISEERTIIVMDTNVSLSYSPTKVTNGSVTVNINVTDNYFDYILLPNGEKDYKRNTNYLVNENGTYKFNVYSKDGTSHTKEIIINNIDKTSPVVSSCTGKINENKTIYTVVTNDQDILKYVYNNQYTTSNKQYTINANVPNANLVVYDNAGNTTNIKCTSTVIYNYDKPITPQGNENIIKQIDTNTLKVWIEKKSRGSRTSYHVAHVWAKDPYNQLKSGVPNNFGRDLMTPKNILEQAITRNGFQNKAIIAVNGGGFVLAGVYDVNYYKANSAWDKSSVSPIVISEGQVYRDITGGRFPNARNHITYAMKRDGNLAYYTYNYNTVNDQHNINTGRQIINDGVKNTWGFMPVLVSNGQVMSGLATDKNIRNAICQIDKNNFLLITDIYVAARNGFSFNELAQYMVSLGCKTGFNLDGGGSVAMLYKDMNSSTISVVSGGSRNIADILYFHE